MFLSLLWSKFRNFSSHYTRRIDRFFKVARASRTFCMTPSTPFRMYLMINTVCKKIFSHLHVTFRWQWQKWLTNRDKFIFKFSDTQMYIDLEFYDFAYNIIYIWVRTNHLRWLLKYSYILISINNWLLIRSYSYF